MSQKISGEKLPERLKVKAPDGSEAALPKLVRGKYVVLPLFLDVVKDWNVIQLIYSYPAGMRSRMIRDVLHLIVNALHVWQEKSPAGIRVKIGKKLSDEERRRLLKSRLKVG